MHERIAIGYQDDPQLRKSFNALAKETFGLNFEGWYKSGFWKEKYIPYSIIVADEVVANVSVNIIDFTLAGAKRQYLQLGTVMTKPAYRKQGLIRALLDQVKRDYESCPGMFLWANDSVREFYPRFGFTPCAEFRFQKDVAIDTGRTATPVAMQTSADWDFFLSEKAKRQSCGLLEMDTDGLLMFFLSQFMRESVYYLKDLDAYVIAEIEAGILTLHDVYAHGSIDMDTVIQAFGRDIRKAHLAFTPKDTSGFTRYEHREADSTFFISGEALAGDMKAIQAFPALVHA